MRLLVCLAVAAIPTLAHAATPFRVYLNRDGGTLTGGRDDPSRNRSWIASAVDGGEVTVPAFTGGDRRWRAVVACVKDHFAPFAIEVVDSRPSSGDYTMIMVGGHPGMLGMGRGVSGVAPADGVALRRAVGFAFSASLDDDPAGTCDTVAHEAGHTLGLDHVLACDDLMSYGDCGKPTFLDRASACGEFEARACDGGGKAQNSFQRLATLVGLRDAAPAPPADDADDGGSDDDDGSDDDGSDDDGSDDDSGYDDGSDDDGSDDDSGYDDGSDDDGGYDDGSGDAAEPTDDAAASTADDADATDPEPALTGCGATRDDDARSDDEGGHVAAPTIDLPRSHLRGDRWIAIRVELASTRGVAELALEWTTPEATYTWSCSAVPDDVPVTCRSDERGATFALRVGTGARAVRAVSIDRAGRRHAGASETIELR